MVKQSTFSCCFVKLVLFDHPRRRPGHGLLRQLRDRPGWTVNPTAPTPRPPAGGSAATRRRPTASGAKQLGTTVSGTFDLVTGASAGAAAGDNDLDGGVTTIQSPPITLPASGTLTRRSPTTWRTARTRRAPTSCASSWSARPPRQVFQELGAANNDNGRGRRPPPTSTRSPARPCASGSRPPTPRRPAWSRPASTTCASRRTALPCEIGRGSAPAPPALFFASWFCPTRLLRVRAPTPAPAASRLRRANQEARLDRPCRAAARS